MEKELDLLNKDLLVFKATKSKYFKSFLSSLIFLVLGIQVFKTLPFIAIIILVFFGLSLIASLIPLLPNQAYLKLDKGGFTIRSMFRTVKINWNEVNGFETRRKYMREIVSYDFNYQSINDKNYINIENLVGDKEVLPDNYGFDPKNLVKILEKYRERYKWSNN